MFGKLQKSWQMRVDKWEKYGIMIVLKQTLRGREKRRKWLENGGAKGTVRVNRKDGLREE